ncbi:NosD domain-containing protein [Haloarcula nitratireducens]|uniref:Right-handed parallel beta-helix repeat-containing protein n=1 Tax=Haloarcula nitratireducens TaxID=2487749 RepID=A0AAW4P7K8_9EURY|nr:right-handed parallel beta-helix repeat-containing protein [Halomicroarcula nitratireducens]MBX0293925.1 right-handed parallel beta-helix repeat-containing protein [Halomicroarcula nitratireducens]
MEKRAERSSGDDTATRSRRRFLETVGATGGLLAVGSGQGVASTDPSAEEASLEAVGRDGTGGDAVGSLTGHEISSCTTITSPGTYDVVDDISSAGSGVCIDVRADDVTIRGNGYALSGDGGGTGVGANLGATSGGPITIRENVEVEDLTVNGFETAVGYEEVTGGRVEGVTARGNGTGVSLRYGVTDVTVRNSTLADSGVGFRTVGSPNVYGGPENNTFEYNDVESNDRGIWLGLITTDHDISCNRIVGNRGGAFHSGGETRGHVYDGNVICSNSEYGLRNVDNPPEDGIPAFEDVVEATGNYWGASDGPSSVGDPATPYEDPVTGALADGGGDGVSESLDAGIANVHFDPFEASQPAGAGRR